MLLMIWQDLDSQSKDKKFSLNIVFPASELTIKTPEQRIYICR